ncbi:MULTISPECIES: NAD(P)H-binding protein [unclassified Arthrobacter]|uniref:NAD(P)H-binding protein n=1 Tax=unclassified Arthrobacter TaxID=235627 RepID=UPI00159D92C2|nr:MULTISPECIES: NAD(P)H-binding protein [unclassified Arthrobacter]MCQ9166106.1 NAD(P)H-binding protein [Arthrobacter sp. STN4]NVM97112.1 NAD(P)H-binding protein [Arthrobacter sp. SDTb3-6]
MGKVMIIGGHGKIALLLAPLLKAAGWEVSGMIRNAAQIDDVAAAGATPVVHDVVSSSVEELAGLLAGQDAVIWSAGAGGGNPDRTYAVDRDAAIRSMDAAEQAGVGRYIMVSYLGARTDHGVGPGDSFFAYAEAKAAADLHLRSSGLAWTILGPGALTLDAPTGTIATDTDAAHRNTSRANVALVAAAVLERPDTVGRTIEFTDGNVRVAQALNP